MFSDSSLFSPNVLKTASPFAQLINWEILTRLSGWSLCSACRCCTPETWREGGRERGRKDGRMERQTNKRTCENLNFLPLPNPIQWWILLILPPEHVFSLTHFSSPLLPLILSSLLILIMETTLKVAYLCPNTSLIYSPHCRVVFLHKIRWYRAFS